MSWPTYYHCSKTSNVTTMPVCHFGGVHRLVDPTQVGDIVDLGIMVCPATTAEQRLAELKRRIAHVLDVANAGTAACGPWVKGELQKALAA